MELRVRCDYLADNIISVLEYKGGIQNGIAIHYDSLWRKHDSCFFVNGRKNGTLIFWDTLGEVVGKRKFRNGIQIGKDENYYSPGHPSLIKNYNDSGQEEGLWQEWWPNGNKKLVAQCHKGEVIEDEEYFPNGVLRLKEKTAYQPKPSKEDAKVVFYETFSPAGKSTGKVVNGTGETWLFDAKPDSVTHKHRVLHEVYKDGFEVSNQEADSQTVEKLLR